MSRVFVRFRNGKEVDKAIDVIYSHPALSKLPFDSPDGYELHIDKVAISILKEAGLTFTEGELT